MINEIGISLTQRIEAFPLPAKTKAVVNKPELDSLVIGKRYHAVIESKLVNGRASVLAAGQSFQMELPASIANNKNTEIELTLISKEPTLRFLLLNPLINLDHEQSIAFISQAGQLLSDSLKVPSSQLLPQQILSTPIIQSLPNSVSELASKLQQALTQSGLFYESHLAEWLAGKRSLDQLHQEPQLKFSDTDKNFGNYHMVQQQLMALETGAVVWKGEIWPGQLVEWVVIEQEKEDGQEVEKDSSNWISRINISLPYLGQIMITFRINQLGTSIHIETEQDITNNLLVNNQYSLIKAIETEGIKVQSLIVNKDGSISNQ